MRIRTRAWRVVVWGGLLVLCSLAGGLWWAYSYYTNSDTLARLIESEAPRYLPGGHLDVGHVEARFLGGKFQLTHLSLRQAIDGLNFQALRIPWLNIRYDPEAMLDGRFAPHEVVVMMPTLRLIQRKDGTWNLQGLFASPWPGSHIKKLPVVWIKHGTVELCDGPNGTEGIPILRDVAVKLEPTESGNIRFEGDAKGDAFDRITLEGTVNRATGVVTLKGDLTRLMISETLRQRMPRELGAKIDEVNLTAGDVDIQIPRLVYDPGAKRKIAYEAAAQIRSGLWACPKLPFPINDLYASLTIRDNVLKIEHADGYNGETTVRAEGQVKLGNLRRSPMDLHIEIANLALDERLRKWTPPAQAKLWQEFKPSGKVNATIDVAKAREGDEEPEIKLGVDCVDVSMCYVFFQYPLDHVRGRIDWTKKRVDVSLHSVIGRKPITAKGAIHDPSPRKSRVILDFEADELPVDQTLLNALPPDVRKIVEEFRPKGSVRGTAHLVRNPPLTLQDDPRGRVSVDATLDLNKGCSIQWVNLPYTIDNLTGRLELHPNRCIFRGMSGNHGQATITGQGEVQKIGNKHKIKVGLSGRKLLFDDELRYALPPAWQMSWGSLDPTGSSDVDAAIEVDPGKPEDYKLVITPRPSTSVKLRYSRDARPGIDLGGTFELPMNNVRGQFIYHNGLVQMRDVGFTFYNAPVNFAAGAVRVENSGKFQLKVREVWARDLRLDGNLRKIMPPVMAQFAKRLDDGKTFTLKGNLGLSWSGLKGAPVLCGWDEALVVFNGNEIQAGVPLTALQGQLDSVRGWSDGERLEVHGVLRLASVSLLGQQVTKLESPLNVAKGWATLDNISGQLLKGKLGGTIGVSLDATPKYSASVSIRNADLQEYAKTIPGRQAFRGLVDARIDLEGLGADLHNLQGSGEAHVTQGDLGKLPFALRMVKTLNLSPATNTAFDSADVNFTVQSGQVNLDPIKFTGDAFTLMGKGTLDLQEGLDLRLNVQYGRDMLRVPLLSAAIREASGQIVVVRVSGTPSYPNYRLEALPALSDLGKNVIERRRGVRPE